MAFFPAPPRHRRAAAFGAALSLVMGCVGAAAAPVDAGDAQAIRAASKAYQDALERGDTAALQALWTPDGDIVDDLGNIFGGREAASLHAAEAADAGPKPEIRIESADVRFLTADVALEDGTVEVRPPGGAPLSGRFSAVWVRHEGTWKLTAVRESGSDAAAGPALLEDLDWMVGDWTVAEDGGREARPGIDVKVRWNETRTFLVRDMRFTAADGGEPLSITQRIGWDPLARRIRSWAFGSDGSHGEATWARDGGSWVSQTVSVRPDGSQTTSLVIYSFDGKDRCTVRSIPTHVGAEHAAQVEMTMVRKAEGPRP